MSVANPAMRGKRKMANPGPKMVPEPLPNNRCPRCRAALAQEEFIVENVVDLYCVWCGYRHTGTVGNGWHK